jgi:hypothetical protein
VWRRPLFDDQTGRSSVRTAAGEAMFENDEMPATHAA